MSIQRLCEQCGTPFMTHQAYINRGGGRFCSNTCRGLANRTGTSYIGGDHHRRVWEQLHGPIPPGYEVHHVDRNKRNDDPVNLELRPVLEHMKLHRTGAANPNARFTDDDIRAIREKYAAGVTQWQLADEYGTWQSTISKITRRKLWPHLTE